MFLKTFEIFECESGLPADDRSAANLMPGAIQAGGSLPRRMRSCDAPKRPVTTLAA